jgi:Carboxypeptidase regulatory-like domain/TonB dependent receptor
MSRKWTLMSICLLGLCFSGTAAMAQTVTGSVRGIVSDPSGAHVAGAKVTITNVSTGVTGQTVTDRDGLYDFEFLVLGKYTVSVTAPGFETGSVGPFQVQIDQIVTADVGLSMGKTDVTVHVSDQALLLNTENSTISTSISSYTLENMPLDGLNVQTATLYLPGSVNPNSALMGGTQGTERDAYTVHEGAPSDVQPSFNGNRQQSNSYILDGIDVNETLQNGLGYNPSPYSIQEVHVITGNADAEYGNVNGGEVVMVTKNGTNQFHGNAFEYHEDGGLTANTWANKDVGNSRANYNQNQFGAAVGGPIFKNKLFFFGNYEGFRNNSTGIGSAGVPTSAMRGLSTASGQYDTASTCPAGNGDFAGAVSYYGMTGLWNTTNGYNNETLYPGPNGNCVPINPNNKLFAFLLNNPKAFPLPNHAPSPGALLGGNYQGVSSTTTHNDQGDIRLDYTLNAKDSLMGKFSYGDAWDEPLQVPVPAVIPFADDYPFTNVALAWTHIFSPTLVNNARAGFTRISLNASIPVDLSGVFGTTGNSKAGIGMPAGYSQSDSGFSYIDVASGEGWDISNFGSEPPIQGFAVDNNFDYNDVLNWEHGKHITKFGVEFLRYQQDYYSSSDTGGALGYFGYNGNDTANWNNCCDEGYGFAEFLLDTSSKAQISGVHGPFGQRQWRDAFYAQDDWKVTSKLTVNLGLRYSYEQPNYEVHNKMVNVNLAYAEGKPVGTPIADMLEFAGQKNSVTGGTNSRALINPYYLDFMPRIGFAWRAMPKLVVRAGYGSTDELESTGSSLRMTQNVQFQPAVTNNSTGPTGTTQGSVFTLNSGLVGRPAAAAGAGAQYYAWDPNMRPAVISQFNLNFQYQIGNSTSVQAGYVGQVGQHLAVPLWANQYTTDDTCAGLSSAAAIDSCYQTIEPYFALVGNPNSPDNPGSDVLKETVSRGISNYHSLQATLQHHQSKGLEFLVNYTYGKSLTNNPGYFGTDNYNDDDSYWQNIYSPKTDYGPSTFDARQVVTGIMVYQLPFGHGKQFGSSWNRGMDETFGGWQFSTNAQVNSGYPLTMHQGAECSNNCSQNLSGDYFEFANHYGPMKVVHRGKGSDGIFRWFGTDPSAMPCTSHSTAPSSSNPDCAYGRTNQDVGTARVGSERGPGYQNYDLSLSKGFDTVREQVLKVRVDAFNAFNISSYGTPNSYIGGNASTAWGVIGGTASGPRKIELSFVYSF